MEEKDQTENLEQNSQELVEENNEALQERLEMVKQTQYGTIAGRSIVNEMQQSYLDYAMSVIVARALPDARDGLKPVHRRIIYAMGEMNLTSSAKFVKSAKIVGEVLGKYHPHGDMAVYDTMVGMAQSFKMRHPLVQGQGNFGSMDGDRAAAPRYTEARLAAISSDMLSDIDKETVDLTPNYDNTLNEPTVLPTRVPNLLLNGTVGIAVGMATNIPPHNLIELCDGIIHLIENPNAELEDLMNFVKGPDFPTGASIYGAEGIKNAYATGKGKIIIRGEAEIMEDKRGFKIMISSIPFQVNKADLISKIAELVKEKRIDGITDIRDESDRNKEVQIVIELKNNSYPKKVLNRIYELTQLQSAYHINILALVDRIQPRILNLKSALNEFIKHRQEVVRRRCEYDLARAKEREHILEGLKKALDHIDEIIEIIKKSANREDAAKNLIAKFEFSKIQVNAILDMRLSALAALERKKVEDELISIRKLIGELEAILADPKKILEIVKKEIIEIKEKYGEPRRTKIFKQELTNFKAEDLIPNESVVITLTKSNYIKRVPVEAYKKQNRGGKGIVGITPKDEDQVIIMETAQTHDTIYFFTNIGRVFSTKVFEIPSASRQAKGQAIVNIIQMSPNEIVTAMLIIRKDTLMTDKYFLMGTAKGVVKKTKIDAYQNIRKTGLIAIKLNQNDQLKFIEITSPKDAVVMATRKGQGIVFKEEDVRPMGRSAAGVIGIRLKSEDEVISMGCFDPNSEEGKKNDIVTILENGYGKRTQVVKNYPVQKRGGYGVRASKVSDKTGQVVEAIITNDPNQDLIIVSKMGQIIRIPMKSAKQLGRDTQGVRLMRLAKNDKVASVSPAKKEQEETQPETVEEAPKN
ncbi:MAG: DNA gyrase subunit A [candidate division WS2 bacterium ADurb.Bin280]|uniref:DNA gyrase subunit A n=1 Tax=candidate division WS2 bacterium ADurb.Bin280 TaxID=1852829 RepID=A0A1V5SGI8_9BACT|nr:MAG: DNA gyrase subunit A [candidate division WS2 bacterium ADurb.Bin280]